MLVGPLLGAFVCAAALCAQPPAGRDWPFEILHLKNGAVWKGMVLDENPSQIRFQNIRRQPGRPTLLITALFEKRDVEKVERLPETDRVFLKERVEELDPKGDGERKRMESLDLTAVDWCGKKNGGLRYDSDYFRFVSNAPEEIVRRAAARLEQVFIAYARILPPRVADRQPTTIHLFNDRNDYQEAVGRRRQTIQNPAFFDAQTNEILCGSDLKRLGTDLADVKKQNRDRLAELDAEEAKYRKLYAKQKADLARVLQPIQDDRKRIASNDRRNDAVFDQATQQLFATLYHESFHAYLGTWVLPKSTGAGCELPRWLNEGLAQVFETSLVEAGELRIGHLDRDRWLKVRELIAADKLPRLRALLKTGRDDFVIEHAGQKWQSDSNYLACWALANYLLLERQSISGETLDAYCRALRGGSDPTQAFERWTGEPAEEFEKHFAAWFGRVQPDGSVMQISSGR